MAKGKVNISDGYKAGQSIPVFQLSDKKVETIATYAFRVVYFSDNYVVGYDFTLGKINIYDYDINLKASIDSNFPAGILIDENEGVMYYTISKRVYKYDIYNGGKIWETQDIVGGITGKKIKIGDYIYCIGSSTADFIYKISNIDGSLIRKVRTNSGVSYNWSNITYSISENAIFGYYVVNEISAWIEKLNLNLDSIMSVRAVSSYIRSLESSADGRLFYLRDENKTVEIAELNTSDIIRIASRYYTQEIADSYSKQINFDEKDNIFFAIAYSNGFSSDTGIYRVSMNLDNAIEKIFNYDFRTVPEIKFKNGYIYHSGREHNDLVISNSYYKVLRR